MEDSGKLLSYLTSLERALGGAPEGRRQQILEEIRGRVERSKADGLTLDEALARIGSVETVCREFGYLPNRKRRGEGFFLKFVLLMAGLFFAMVLALMSFVGWNLIKVFSSGTFNFETFRNEWGQFEDLDDRFRIGGQPLPPKGLDDRLPTDTREMTISLDEHPLKEFYFKFTNGKLRVSWTEKNEVSVRCKFEGGAPDTLINVQGAAATTDVRQSFASKCDIGLPSSVSMVVTGNNADVNLNRIKSDFRMEVSNANVQIEEDEKTAYVYKLEVVNGRLDDFSSNPSKDAKSIEINVSNGFISKKTEK